MLIPESCQDFNSGISLGSLQFCYPSIPAMCCIISVFVVHLKCSCVDRFQGAKASVEAALQRSSPSRWFSLGPCDF